MQSDPALLGLITGNTDYLLPSPFCISHFQFSLLHAVIVGYAGGYSAIASCGIILILVLRRSMLHALGFTYAEILPLHRWLGVAIVFWSTLHTVGYLMYYDWDNTVSEEFNFYDIGRSTMNICGCFAFVSTLYLLSCVPSGILFYRDTHRT